MIRSVIRDLTRLLPVSLLFALTGCAGVRQNEYAEFDHYVAAKVLPGVLTAQAVQILSQDSYKCKQRGARAECHRHEDGFIKFCRYQVLMIVDRKQQTVLKTRPDILCAKKYP